MAYIKVGDLNINYELMGDGHPLVLIIGLIGNLDWWDPGFLDSLAERYRVLIFDNRGAGRTETPADGEISIEQMAGDTAGLLEALDIDSAHVLGVSMGGMIAQELVLNYPDKVDKLVLSATYCGTSSGAFPTLDTLRHLADRSGTPQEQVERYCSLHFCKEWLESHQKDVSEFSKRLMDTPVSNLNAVRQFAATLKFEACKRLPNIVKPTLIAYGTEDVIIPPQNSKIMAGRIPGAKLIEYEKAGHGFIWERKNDFLRDLKEFLG